MLIEEYGRCFFLRMPPQVSHSPCTKSPVSYQYTAVQNVLIWIWNPFQTFATHAFLSSLLPSPNSLCCQFHKTKTHWPVRSNYCWFPHCPFSCALTSFKTSCFTKRKRRHDVLPARIELGIECWSSKTNLNILLPGGRNPNLSAMSTTLMPMGGIKKSRVNVMATVVRSPSCELPAPAMWTIRYLHFSQNLRTWNCKSPIPNPVVVKSRVTLHYGQGSWPWNC